MPTLCCVIDAGTPVGRDINRLIVGFVRQEFLEASFHAERVKGRLRRMHEKTATP